jgi:putative transposase
MKDNPYAALGRCCYQDCLLHNRVLEEEVSEGRVMKVKPRIRRRFAMCKITLMKIDYQARTIRITLKPGEYPTISWKSTWFEHRIRGRSVGKAIIFDDRVVIPFKSSEEIYVRRVIGWDSN